MLITERGEILLEKQGEKGIWGGLWAFPQIASSSELFQWLIDHHLGGGRDVTYWSSFRHTFSHFHLQIKPIQLDVDQLAIPFDSGKFIWHPLTNELSIGTPAPIQKMLQELIVKRSF
jgi:A/G-specific adenine glycosylase